MQLRLAEALLNVATVENLESSVVDSNTHLSPLLHLGVLQLEAVTDASA